MEELNGQENLDQGENQSNKKENVGNKMYSSEKLKRAQAMRHELKKKMDAYRAAKVRKEELRQAQDELKRTLAKARRDIDRERKKLVKQEDKLREIAGWIKEKNEDRAHHAIKGFFDILNLFDDKNGTFSNEYNSLHNTEKVYKALLNSATYYGENKDYIAISGKKLRKLIQAEKDKFLEDMKEAREILGLDVDALLAERENKKSDENSTDKTVSDDVWTEKGGIAEDITEAQEIIGSDADALLEEQEKSDENSVMQDSDESELRP
ncbi:MAG: hypothetical protein IJ727_03355 [Treponema sp.]|nr:hypothetical protein [Treponema sp.]